MSPRLHGSRKDNNFSQLRRNISSSVNGSSAADTIDSPGNEIHIPIRPKTFFFVNKDSSSKSFSRSDPEVVADSLRHIQENLWMDRSTRRRVSDTSHAAGPFMRNNVTQTSTTSDTSSGLISGHISEDQGRDSSEAEVPGSWSDLDPVSSSQAEFKRSAFARSPGSDWTAKKRSTSRQALRMPGSKPVLSRRNTTPHRRLAAKSEFQQSRVESRLTQAYSTAGPPTRNIFDVLSEHEGKSVVSIAERVMQSPSKSLDSFACTASPITQQTHTCLKYFESLWLSHSLPASQSLGHQIVRNCLSDELQMACLVAAMVSRLENFHDCRVSGGSSRYTALAVRYMRGRLAQGPIVQSKEVYAILKLYVAEAYRANLAGALVHLNGAAAAYERVGDWKSFDLDMAVTLCGTGEAFFIPQVWSRPTVFRTIADPGPARDCLSHDSFWSVNEADPDDRLAEVLIPAFLGKHVKSQQLDARLSILNDITEYNKVRRKTLQLAHQGVMVPTEVTCWTHLRRINLGFRLLSVDTTGDWLSHCVRICLIAWLEVVSDLSGFRRNLEIVASHLRVAIQALTGSEMSSYHRLVTWMMFLGTAIGKKESDGSWFALCLVEFLMKSGMVDRMDLNGWRVLIEDVNREFFYCHELQRGSVEEVASWLYSLSVSLTLSAAAV